MLTQSPPYLSQKLNRTQLEKMKQAIFSARHKSLAGEITKDAIGLGNSAIHALFLPWHLIPACVNIAKLVKHTSELHELEKVVKENGLRFRKRDSITGVFTGGVTKGVTIVLFVGHDDFVGIFDQAEGLMTYFGGEGAKEMASVIRDEVNCLDHDYRLNPVTEKTTAVAHFPIEKLQEWLDLDTGFDQPKPNTGYNAGAEAVVEQVVVVGAVQAATEEGIDAAVKRVVGPREGKSGAEH